MYKSIFDRAGENRGIYMDTMEELIGCQGESITPNIWLNDFKSKVKSYVTKMVGAELKQSFGEQETSNLRQINLSLLLPTQAGTWPAIHNGNSIPSLSQGMDPFSTNDPLFRKALIWLGRAISEVMRTLAGSLYPRMTAAGFDELFVKSFHQVHLALRRVEGLWTPDREPRCTANMLKLYTDAEGDAEKTEVSEACIDSVFNFMTDAGAGHIAERFDSGSDHIASVKNMAAFGFADSSAVHKALKGYLQWDTYDLPNPKFSASSHLKVAFNTFCNADVRDLNGRKALDKFDFVEFNGVEQVDFNAGVVFLHVDKVCVHTVLCVLLQIFDNPLLIDFILQNWVGSEVCTALKALHARHIAKDHCLIILGGTLAQLSCWSAQLHCVKGKFAGEEDEDEEVDEDEPEERGDKSYKPKFDETDLIEKYLAVYAEERGSVIVLRPVDDPPPAPNRLVFDRQVNDGMALVLFTTHAAVPACLHLDPVLYYSVPVLGYSRWVSMNL
jgi:hypothetical protein